MQNRSERASWCVGFYQDVVVAKRPQKTLEKTIGGGVLRISPLELFNERASWRDGMRISIIYLLQIVFS